MTFRFNKFSTELVEVSEHRVVLLRFDYSFAHATIPDREAKRAATLIEENGYTPEILSTSQSNSVLYVIVDDDGVSTRDKLNELFVGR